MAKPLRAEERSPKESIAEELKTKEAEPPGYGKYTDRLILIADLDVFITLSDLVGSDALWGGGVNALLAPTYKFNDKNFLILMYDGQYYKKREFYSDEVGPRERSEFQGHTITPMLRMIFGERSRYSITPSFFFTTTYNKDIDTDDWADGLYNYRDRGAGLDFDMTRVFGRAGTLSLGAQYYHREYPNYASLLSLTGLDSVRGYKMERHEKDYDGVITRAGYNWTKGLGFSWGAEYFLLYKMLDDKKVIDNYGMPSSEDQRDYLHSLDLRFWYILDIDGGLKLGLDLNGGLNRSNQDYFEIVGPGPLDYEFTRNFYDYDFYRITPNISYTFALFPFTTSLFYAYQKTDYTDRSAKFSNGFYKDKTQWETHHEINLGLRYNLTKDWSLLAQWQNIAARSNNDDERVYQYDYTLNNYSAGVSYSF